VLLIVIIAITLLRTGVLRTTNTQIASSLETFIQLTNGSAVIPTPEPPDTAPPSVSLISPADGDSLPAGTTFSFTPSDNAGLLNATLYANFTGTFAANSSNTSLTNGSTNTVSTNVSVGFYVWNVRACDTSNLCAFAPANFSVTVVASGTNVWNYTSNLNNSDDRVYGVALDTSEGVLYLSGYSSKNTGTGTGSPFWHAQKVNVSGTSPAQVWNASLPGGGLSTARDVVLGPTGFVLAVGEETGGASQSSFRVDKYASANGTQMATHLYNPSGTFGDDGWEKAVINDASPGSIIAGGHVESGSSDFKWRIDTYSTATPLVVTGPNYTNSFTGVAGCDCVFDLALDASGGALYAVGADATGVRVQRQNYTNVSIVFWSTGYVAPSGASGSEFHIAFDPAGYLYVATGSAFGNGAWFVSKLFASNGSFVWNYTSNASVGTDLPKDIAYHNGFVYVAGFDEGGTSFSRRWRMEKLNAATGVNVLNYTSDPTATRDEWPEEIEIDSSTGWVYLAGWDHVVANSDQRWRVERVAG
jgi:hypothetical protein